MSSPQQSGSADRRLMKKLMRVMEIEIEKPYEEMDDEVVALCADCLMELKGKEELSFDEIRRRLEEIGLCNVKPSARKRHLRRILIAAVIAALLLILSLLAIGNDTFNNFWRHHFWDMHEGDSYSVDGQVISKDGEMRFYDSIKAFRQAEHLTLLFPTVLPEQAMLEQICIGSISNKVTVFCAIVSTEQLTFKIELNVDLSFDLSDTTKEKEQIHGLDCIVIKESSMCQINFKHRNNVYTVVAPTYEDAVFIIQHLEGEF